MTTTNAQKKSSSNSNHLRKKIPHLNIVNGKVEIDSNDPKQVKWFKEFKK